MAIAPPFNLNKWIEENRDTIKPPVRNKSLFKDSDDYSVMIVAGPNARKDYHYNKTEELFCQLEDTIEIHIQKDGQKRTMKLSPGGMYLNPYKVTPSPIHNKGSIGLVVERKRADMNLDDGHIWSCGNCNTKLYEAYFTLVDIEKDFLGHFKHFNSYKKLHTCDHSETALAVDKRLIEEN